METLRRRLVAVRDAWWRRRWRWRLGVWALLVLLTVAVPYEGSEPAAYLFGLMAVCGLLAVVDPRPLMIGGFGLVLTAIARVLVLEPRFSPYVDGAAEPWVAAQLLLLPLAVLPPLVVTWAIVTRAGRDPLAWVRLPGTGVAGEA